MRKVLIAGNWKMNLSSAQAHALARGVAALPARPGVEVAIFPAFPHLPSCKDALAGSQVLLGAQTLSERALGAFTGEVAGEMLTDIGCTMVLVGHSERRHVLGESDALVAAKFLRAHHCGLTPVLCVGETLAQREAGLTFATVSAQLDAVMAVISDSPLGLAALKNTVLAYEPVWAIGTGRTATPEQAQEVHAYLRSQIAHHDAKLAGLIQIVYGGSVKGDNAGALIAMPDIDGALVGGAALKLADFDAILAGVSG
jgi:triosephosphate isomerase (TIM)